MANFMFNVFTVLRLKFYSGTNTKTIDIVISPTSVFGLDRRSLSSFEAKGRRKIRTTSWSTENIKGNTVHTTHETVMNL